MVTPLISGMQQVNRAVDGDLVAVKLETQHENKSKSLMIPRSETSTVDFSLENAEPTPEALEGLAVQPMESTPDGIAYGVVVGIIRRNWRQYAGSIDISRGESMMDSEISSTALFKPVDPKIPNILIMTRHYQNLKGKRLLVTIDEWPVNSSYPYGHYVSILGDDGDRLVETQVVLHEFQVPHEAFSSEVMACLPSKDWKITEDIIKERMVSRLSFVLF